MLVGHPHELLVLGPPADPNIYQATVFSAGAALTLVVWDTLLTFDHEVDYIWPAPRGLRRASVRWLYLFSRWFGLLNQIGIQTWRSFIAACPLLPVSTCEAFFILESVTFQLLQLSLYAILVLQIWAVYRRHFGYITVALAIVLLTVVVAITTQTISVPKSTVDGACIILHAPATFACSGIGMMVSQIVLLFLTYRGKALLQPVARRSRLMTVIVRDGMLLLGVVAGIVLVSCLYFLFNQVVVNIFFPWVPVVPSILTPRMILNMHAAAEPTQSVVPEFTTDLGTMPNTDNEIQHSSTHEAEVIYEQPRDSP